MFASIIDKHQTEMQIPSTFFDLPADAAHVLILNAFEHRAWLEADVSTLDTAEQERAARYVNPWHGQRYACTRGLLRRLLGRFLKQEPAEIEFSYGTYGKPALTGVGGLNFNLSHSGDWVALGFCRERRIGIDMEIHIDSRDCLAVAYQCFSPRELAELNQRLNTAQAFCDLWVRKEAALKAAGLGLDALQNFCTCDSVVSLQDEQGATMQWHVSDMPLHAGHSMALAIEGRPVRNVSFRL